MSQHSIAAENPVLRRYLVAGTWALPAYGVLLTAISAAVFLAWGREREPA